MSFDINWKEFVLNWLSPDNFCTILTEKINQTLPENSPIANIRINQFNLLECNSPDIEILDISDIRDEFLLAAGQCRDIYSPPPMDKVGGLASNGGIIDSASFLYKKPSDSFKTAIFQDGLEFTTLVKFLDDSLRIEFEADVVLNVPSFSFLSLPFKFTLTKFNIETQLIIAVTPTSDRAFLSLPHPPANFHFQLAVDVGDPDKHVLRNVSKIEKFILEQSRLLINDRLVFPKFIDCPIKKNPFC